MWRGFGLASACDCRTPDVLEYFDSSAPVGDAPVSTNITRLPFDCFTCTYPRDFMDLSISIVAFGALTGAS